MSKILKNNTNSAVDIPDTGQQVPAVGTLTIAPQDFDLYSSSDDLITLIGNGSLILNNGTEDLSKSESIRVIQGGFSNKIKVNDDLLSSNRIKVDVTGSLSDGSTKVSPNDNTAATLSEKLISADNKISLVELNDGGNEDLVITLQSGNINTADLNNDASFITLAQAPVQPSDINDFETTTQLNARDDNNRSRSNHVGTQTVSTISDFTLGVQNSETVTSLNFNPSNNILTYTDEDNNSTSVDLSIYLDDTNLNQIVSGSLDSETGIVTFTRDDTTSFTVDFSSLNDQSFINSAIDTHEQTISNHDDVDTVTNSPSSGDLLRYDGTNWTPYSNFKDFATFKSPRGNQLTTFANYLTLTTTIPETGNYKISWYLQWSLNTVSDDFISRVRLNNSTNIMFQQQEPKDSAGNGITVTNINGGTFNTSTNQRHINSGSEIEELIQGSNSITIDFTSSQPNLEATIYNATLIIERF